MALLTLADGRAELDARGYSRFADGRQNIWLNAAKNRFEDYPYDWPWLKTTTTGNSPLTISDLRRVLSVVNATTSTALTGIDPNALIEFVDGSLTTAGVPGGWYLSSETVVSVYPATTTSLSVRYVKFSAELSADADAPLIPARYRSVWLDLAEVDVLRYGVKDRDSANSMEAEVFRRIEEIAGVYAMQGQAMFTEQMMTGASVDD